MHSGSDGTAGEGAPTAVEAATHVPTSFPVVGPPDYFVTYDTERTEHIISDEQLTALARTGGNISLELCLAAVGVCSGFFQNLVSAITSVALGKPLEAWNGFGAVVFAVGATTAVIMGIAHWRSSTEKVGLIQKIRARKAGRMPPSTA